MTAKEKTLPETAPLSPEEIIQLLHLTPLTEEGGMVAETYTSEEIYKNRLRLGVAVLFLEYIFVFR